MIHLRALSEVCARMAEGEDCLDWLLQAEQQLLADAERVERLAVEGDYAQRSQRELEAGLEGLGIFHQALGILLEAECLEDLEAALELARRADGLMREAAEENESTGQRPFCDILN